MKYAALRVSAGIRTIMTICLLSSAVAGFAQNPAPSEPIDLEKAIGIALKNNPQIKQAGLQVLLSTNQLDQSKWQRWPSLSFSASQGFNFGRSIDPYTNQFIQQSISFNNFNLGMGMNVYNGHQLKNTISQNSLNTEAAQKDLEARRNDIMLNVALAYLQVLNTQELTEVAKSQVAASQFQVERTSKLVEAGSSAEGNLLDMKAQLANDELALVNAENNLETAHLNLKQLMNVTDSGKLRLVPYPVADPALRAYDASVQEIYNTAVNALPQMKAADLRIKAADRGIDIARGLRMPTLNLSGGIGSNYSSAAPRNRFLSDGGAPTQVLSETGDFITIDNQNVKVYRNVVVPSGTLTHFGYFNQLDFNRNTSVSLNLRIPIFNAFQAKYQIEGAKIQKLNSETNSDIVKLQIRQSVEQAYIDMSNSAKRYTATANQVRALQEAHRMAESRFNYGALNATDYNIAKVNLDKARANLVQTKYDYLFRTKILDFYMGRPLTND